MCGRYNRFVPAVEQVEEKPAEFKPVNVGPATTPGLFDVELVDGPADPFLPVVEFDPEATWVQDESLITVGPVS